jgi:imidazolonepropionase-like amidohydrolase
MLKNKVLIFLSLLPGFLSKAQITFPVNGAVNNIHSTYALTHANIYTDAETLLKNATLIFKDGKIISVAVGNDVPKDAVVMDMKGKYIYPAFIDIYSDYGVPTNNYPPNPATNPMMERPVKGAYGWNMAIRGEFDSYEHFVHNIEKAEQLKKLGFGTVLSCPKDGIIRGSGLLANLNAHSKENLSIVIDKAACYYSLNKGSSPQDYPSSLTGCIALLRQTYYDANWYKENAGKVETNISLKGFNKLRDLPAIMEGNDKFTDLRAAKIGKEFGVNYIMKAGGNEYQRMNDIAATGLKYILPLNFPEVLDVEDAYEAENIPLAEMLHWELAPTNPAEFEKNNISFCFTTSDLKNKDDFWPNLRKAVSLGLSEKTALKALTTNPAQYVNAANRIGALKKDYYANFFVSTRSVFDEEASIIMSVVNGEPEIFQDPDPADIRGNYSLSTDQKTYEVKFDGDPVKPAGTVKIDTAKKGINYSLLNNVISFSFHYDTTNAVRLSGNYDAAGKLFTGRGQWANGNWFDFSMKYISAVDTTPKKKELKKPVLPKGKVLYPFSGYGIMADGSGKEKLNKVRNSEGSILIKNATVWTNEKDSVMEGADVLVTAGKIVAIGKAIDAGKTPNVKVIDGKGMHLTPGIIDEHSHIAISAGVNEGGQASSAEVRMGDVINPDDINIYRQLSGGVTACQLLHGSANPIGGQSSVIKLRWGHSPEDMKFEKADEFIKFALGENVKQCNWGDHAVVRFPQSRMGVEQVYKDFFTRAKEYNQQWDAFKLQPKGKGMEPRRDLELDALGEILVKKRFITCHSYMQAEINMLMHVADSFGFKVNTFTHILEGYKVADKMKAHGANASTFSDWWAYKNEVMEAIPYNAALLTQVGVNTAVNSDDAEMGRRLNQEAAKAIKYGGLNEVQALKLVTLNPAKMLHLDDKVGSIKVGKSADLVLWTDNPLSIYAKVSKTLIDGQIYFDREEDLKMQQWVNSERARLIALLLKQKQGGAKTVKHQRRRPRLYHCNTIEGISEEETGHR